MDVEIRHPLEGEQLYGLPITEAISKDGIICTAQINLSPPEEFLDIFRTIKTPNFADLYNSEQVSEDVLIDIFENTAYKNLPDPFKKYYEEIFNQLISNLNRILKILRWRYSLSGPPAPFSLISYEFSMDGNEWIPLPETEMGWGREIFLAKIPKDATSEIQSIINDDVNEPTSQVLLREAIELKYRNPRSSLVIGIAALEVSLKELISNLIPESQWLVENVQSPPLDRILNQYLPKLPVKNKISGNVLPPPKKLMKTITQGIQYRNKIVHVGKDEFSPEFLEELLFAIEDVLGLLDYYAGFNWALEHIRPEIKALLEQN